MDQNPPEDDLQDEEEETLADDVIKRELYSMVSPAFAERALLERGYLSARPRIAHGR